MGALLDDLSNPDSDFYKTDPKDRMAIVRALQQGDPEWMNYPTAIKADLLKHAGIDTSVMEQAAARKAAIQKQTADPVGTDPTYPERVWRRMQEGAQEFHKGSTSDTANPIAGLPGAMKVMTAPLNAAFEQPLTDLARGPLKMSGEPVQEFASKGADLASDVAQTIGGAVYGAASQPAKAAQVVETEAGPIKLAGKEPTLMEDPEGGMLESNAPASEANQVKLNDSIASKGVDLKDPKAIIDGHIQEQTGIPVDSEVTVGDTPISSSVLDGQTPKVDLADASPQSAVHEAEHMSADINGTPQPPEDNDAIVEGLFRDKDGNWGGAPDANKNARYARNVAAQPEPVTGPKEEAAAGLDENPQTSAPNDPSWKKPKGKKPLADTPEPASQAEADKRGPLMKVADTVVRGWQAMMASLSGPHILVTNQLRLGNYALHHALDSEGPDLIRAMYTKLGREQTQAIFGKLIEAYPEELAKYMRGGSFTQGENAFADAAGKFNFLAHRVGKTATLVTRLKSTLLRQGLDLDALAASGRLGEIPAANMKDAMAVGSKLAMTYEPAASAGGVEGVLGNLLGGLRKFPNTSKLVSMFPRYTANGILAMTEENPLQILSKLFSENGAQQLGGKLYNTTSSKAMSAVLGSAFVYAGWKIEKEHPGVGTVEVFGQDVNPIHQVPGIGQAMALGAAIHQWNNAVPGHEVDARTRAEHTMAESLFGIPGVGLTILDNLKTGHGASRTVGNTLGTVTRPLKEVNDLLGLIDDAAATKRDTSGSIMDPMKANVPGLSNSLPAQHSPERAGELKSSPGYLVGVRTQEASTPVQDELNRLGLKHPAWYPVAGEGPEIAAKNNKYREVAGQKFDQLATQIMNSDQYKSAPDEVKYKLMEKALSGGVAMGKKTSGATAEELMSPAKRALHEAVK